MKKTLLRRILPLLLAATLAFAVFPIISSAATASASDLNGDGLVDIDDVTTLLDALSNGTPDERYDLNGDGTASIEDVTGLLDGLASGFDPEDDQPVSDTLNNANTIGKTVSTYSSWTATGESGAVYAGQSAGSYASIQLRSKNENSGIVTTTSGGYIKEITVTFNSETMSRELQVYGSNTAYTDPTDLYDESKQGTLIGTLTRTKEKGNTETVTLTIEGSYTYVGVRSKQDALFIDEITFVWGSSSVPGPGPVDPPVGVEKTDVLTNANTYNGTGTTYKEWTVTGTSGAVYAGQSGGQNGTIQLRSRNSTSGVVTTSSGGTLTGVRVKFASGNSDNRKIDVYGRSSAYTSPSELYAEAAQGTLLGSFTYDGATDEYSLTLEDGPAFVGLRSNDGAVYLDEITFTWLSGSSEDPGKTDLEKVNEELSALTFDETVASGAEIEVPVAGATYTDVEFEWEVSDDMGVQVDGTLLFEDVETDTAVTVTVYAFLNDAEAEKEFSVTITAAGTTPPASNVDTLTNANTIKQTVTSYSSWTATGTSGAVYAGQSAGGSGTIQIRSNNSNSGIVTTTSAGKVTEVKVTFNAGTNTGRILDVFGKHDAYSDPTDLYDTSTKGEKLGSLTYNGTTVTVTLPLTGEYEYIGLRSNTGAIFIDEIVITWNGEQGDPPVVVTYDTPEEIVNALYELGNNQMLPGGPYTLTGVVTEISSPYSTEHQNVTVTIVVNGMTDMPVDCFRLEGEGADEIDIDDTITVTGELQNYYSKNTNTYEFKSGCTLDALVKAEIGPAPATVVEEQVSYPMLDTLWEETPTLAPGVKSTGNVEVLVIPVGFTNSDSSFTNAAVKSKLEKAFNGTQEDTGWYSLSGYYSEVSFGQLNIHATIADIYNTGVAYNLKQGEAGVDECGYLENALKAYDGTYDYSDFDADGDGYIDCVYMVYLAPYGTEEDDTDLWWAYTSAFSEEGDEEVRLDGKGIFWYMWFSIDFFDEPIYNDGDDVDSLGVTINCETVIHETGHALGLDDYYDYVNDSQPGLGGLVMMDWNQGDHDPYSKAILGWINPTVLKAGEYSMTLSSYTTNGDALFVAREGNGSYFDEFFIITYYTPDGVNALKAAKAAEVGYDFGVLSQSGILVYHVHSTLKDDLSDVMLYDVCEMNNGNESDRLIKVAEKEACVEEGYAADSEYVLFTEGDTLKLVWNDGTRTHLTMSVDSISENGATVSINWG